MRCLLLCTAFIGISLLGATASAQNYDLTTVILVNSQNVTGYNPSQQTPGEFQRYTERYLEHLQIPYELVDVATQAPPDLSPRQLIISGHRGLNLSTAWQVAITNAVAAGVGFVNLDWDVSVGQQAHIQNIFGTTGSSPGTPGSAIRVPQAVVPGGSSPHYVAGLQRRFRNDPSEDIVYNFHPDQGGTVQNVTSTRLTGASGTVIASIGVDPLILARAYGQARAVHFGTLEYLRADRFGFLMGVDDLFWRSLVWAARKPFVVRGFPRLWAVQIDDMLSGWMSRVADLYNTSLTGVTAPGGTGGPWRVTAYPFLNSVLSGSADRAAAIADINAGRLEISPHQITEPGSSYGNLYWIDQNGQPLTEGSWLTNMNIVENWRIGSGGADQIPFYSRSMVPHFWNLRNFTGYDLWNTFGFRYVTEIQQPGIGFYEKTDANRLRLRPFRSYELSPFTQPDENYPIYYADDYTVGSRTGLPPQTFFGFVTHIIDVPRYGRTDLAWPNASPIAPAVAQTVDQFQYYTWRLWSSLAPTQIYTHDSTNLANSTVTQRQQTIQQVSTWLNAGGARHIFMDDLGDYMRARSRSTLVSADLVNTSLTLTFSGNAATADGVPISTEVLYFDGDNEGTPLSVSGFTGGSVVTLPVTPNPLPATTSINPATTAAGGPAFTLSVNGSGFVASSLFMTTAGLVVLFGFVALGVDMGMLYAARADCQKIANAAALAGATEAFFYTSADPVATARTAAVSTARANYTPADSNDNRLQPANVVVNTAERTVQVTVTRTAANQNPVPTYFAKILGFGTVDVSKTATAEVYRPTNSPALPYGRATDIAGICQ